MSDLATSSNLSVAAHYEYAPFGAVTIASSSTSVTSYDLRTYNPFLFSSEYADDALGLVYYNYRHYDQVFGRWLSRDPSAGISEALYVYTENDALSSYDFIGLDVLCNNEKYVSEFENRGLQIVSSPIKVGKMNASGRVVVSKLSLRACCRCVPLKKGNNIYELKVEVKANYRIEIVGVGVRSYGGKKRTKKGYDRTLAHEQLHVRNFQETFDKIVSILSDNGTYSRKVCDRKRQILATAKFNEVKSEWDIRTMNEDAHHGPSWDEWRRKNGKSETDKELW